MRRCRHTWEVAGVDYTPASGGHLKNASPDEILALAFGLTIVTLRCSDCGDIEFRRTPGSTGAFTDDPTVKKAIA